MSETWRTVPGHPLYEVSDRGGVRSWNTYNYRGELPRVLHPAPAPYKRLTIADRSYSVHTLVMLAFVGPRPDGLEVRHLDGDPANNMLDNLAYGTPLENAADRDRHGRTYEGWHNASKTHCKHGHEFTPESTYLYKPRGHEPRRECRVCRKRRQAKYRAGVVGALALSVLMPGGPSEAARSSQCRAVDHRASAGPNDDNSLPGIRRDAEMGGTWSELDMAPVLDGVVLFHERRWQQGTTGTGAPEETTLAYATSLRTTLHGQRVPSLAEALDLAVTLRAHLLLELHHWPTWTPERLQEAVSGIRSRGLEAQVILTGTRGALTALHALDPGLTTLYRVDGDETMTQDQAQRLGLDGLQVPLHGWTPERVQEWRQAGYRVWGRQAEPGSWQDMLDNGLTTVQVNRPGDFLRMCREALG